MEETPAQNLNTNEKPKANSSFIIQCVIAFLLGMLCVIAGAYTIHSINNQTSKTSEKSATQTPTPTDTVNIAANGILATYTSYDLGISFQYDITDPNDQTHAAIITKRVGNKIYINAQEDSNGNVSGDYIEVLSKSTNETMEASVKTLMGSCPSDYYTLAFDQTHLGSRTIPSSEKRLTVMLTSKANDPNSPLGFTIPKTCNNSYLTPDAGSYFLTDSMHPTKLIFVNYGQAPIYSGTKNFDETIKFL